MRNAHAAAGDGAAHQVGQAARRTAAASVVVLVLGAALFGIAWAVAGDDGVSDNWVGVSVVVALEAFVFE